MLVIFSLVLLLIEELVSSSATIAPLSKLQRSLIAQRAKPFKPWINYLEVLVSMYRTQPVTEKYLYVSTAGFKPAFVWMQANPRGEAVHGAARRGARISRRQHRTHEPLAAVAVNLGRLLRGRDKLASCSATDSAATTTSKVRYFLVPILCVFKA